MRKTRKPIALGVSLALVAALGVGATLAWLTAETGTVTNTFTSGDINITLEETGATEVSPNSDDLEKTYKMLPGDILFKDPEVTVKKGSEACWLFVKVVESDNFDSYMTYSIADGWSALESEDGVYYREVKSGTEGATFENGALKEDVAYAVLANGEVNVIDSVTKSQMNTLTANNYPTLTFTAYAVQQANIDSAADAWSVATTGAKPATE